MLESGSAIKDETLTIRFATLENPEFFGRKYAAGYPDKVVANLQFLDGRRKRVKLRLCGLSKPELKYINRSDGSSAFIFLLENIRKNIEKIFMNFFVKKMLVFLYKIFRKLTI